MAQYCYNCKGLVVPTGKLLCPKCGQDLGRRPEIDLHSADQTDRPPITNYTIGFWDDIPQSSRGDDCCALLDPRKLVRPGWIDSDELVLLVSYLKSGVGVAQYRGYSYCRFHCGCPDHLMGSRTFRDGNWGWPEGLSHYVEHHDVMLPSAFVAHCRANKWKIPSKKHWRSVRGVDDSFWRVWVAEVTTVAESGSRGG